MSHTNDPLCRGCMDVRNRYPEWSDELSTWFFALRVEHPEAHLSCFGRGKADQEALFHRGASHAHYGESAHNYNAAIDVWELRKGVYTLDPEWFSQVIEPNLYSALTWYGRLSAPYYELPHIELSDWNARAKRGILSLVEL